MDPRTLAYFLAHSELPDGPCQRILLRYSSEQYTVILLNENGQAFLSSAEKLVNQRFTQNFDTDCWEIPFSGLKLADSAPKQLNSWRVLYDGHKLLIPARKKPKSKSQLPILGKVIVGKENIGDQVIREVRILAKDEPTPFVYDQYGDSYNSSYFLEPRIVETVPDTVFTAVKTILGAGKLAFGAKNYEDAAAKYQKAFHYCHSYYPDDLPPSDLETAAKLKLQSLLNLALAANKCRTPQRLSQAVESCDFVLGMPEAVSADRAKALYRRGQANLLLNDDELALADFTKSLALLNDPATTRAIAECAQARKQRETRLKNNITRAFGK